MQCLNNVIPLVKYIVKGAYCVKIFSQSKHGSTSAWEVGVALKLMNTGKSTPISRHDLKIVVGKLYYPF